MKATLRPAVSVSHVPHKPVFSSNQDPMTRLAFLFMMSMMALALGYLLILPFVL